MLAAYEASNNDVYLQRAQTLADNIAFRQANLTQGLVWERRPQKPLSTLGLPTRASDRVDQTPADFEPPRTSKKIH